MNRIHNTPRYAAILSVMLLSLLSVNVDASDDPVTGLQVITIRQDVQDDVIPVGGTVIPYQEVTLTAQTPGRVEFIGGEEGDSFAKGSVIVQLDQNKLLAQRQSAYAKLGEAQSALQNANMQYWRELESPRSDSYRTAPGGMGLPAMFDDVFSKPMSDVMGMQDSDVNRAADIESQRAMIAQAYSAVSQTQAQIRQIEENLRDTRSVAPFDGQIFRKHVEVGDTVQPGMPLVTFSNVEYLQIRADLAVKLANQLQQGDVIRASIDTVAEPFDVRVSRIFPAADSQHHTVTVKFDMPAELKVATGTYAEVHIPAKGIQVVHSPTVPVSAVVHRSGLDMVFIVDEQNRTDLRVVRLGENLGQSVKVLTGISAGMKVVTNPGPGLKSGVMVEN